MSLVTRVLATLVVSVLATTSFLAGSARAAGAEATKAADYIVSTFKPGTAAPYGEVGSAADSLLALAATDDPKYAADIDGIVAFLKKNAKAYVAPKASGAAGAAKLALVAAAVDADATDFGGVDLVTTVKAGIGANGAFGAWPGPFASGMAMVALVRNGQSVPEQMVDYLLTYAEPRAGGAGGGFACTTYPFDAKTGCPAADPDSTAMAVLGLQAVGSARAGTAATVALEWLAGAQQADGSWQNYAPVNSTGLVGPLFPAGSEQATRATGYVVAHQLPSGALTTGTDTKADLLATQQGILALTGKTYATIGEPAAAAPSTPATTAPTATPAPAPAAPSGTDPAVAWSVGVLVLASAGVVAVTAARGRRS